MQPTAGELANKALKDRTDYNALELGHALCEDVEVEVRKCIENHKHKTTEEEFCIVRIFGANDPLIHNAKRTKYYAWLYLPSPRPNQAVFLYNRALDRITKRLWVLPNALVMARLATANYFVPKLYQTMQAWSVAFFKGTFWEYIRYEHQIDMLSEREYLIAHKQELIDAGCKIPDATFTDPFDFRKIAINKVVDPGVTLIN